MDKRYQIFISSTFADLIDERGKVMETILSLDCFPAGMELFPSMDEEQFRYIKKIIDDSDFYLLIIAGRYGSLYKDGKSYTEKEFEYAVSKNIPVIVFDHQDYTQLPANKTDRNDKKEKLLIEFKKRVSTNRIISFWYNADDLSAKVAKTLAKLLKDNPDGGWIRATNVTNSELQAKYEELHRNYSVIKEKYDELIKNKETLESNQSNPVQYQGYNSIEWEKMYEVKISVTYSYSSIDNINTIYENVYTFKKWFHLLADSILNGSLIATTRYIINDIKKTIMCSPFFKSDFLEKERPKIHHQLLRLTTDFDSVLLVSKLRINNFIIEENDILIILESLKELGLITEYGYVDKTWQLTDIGTVLYYNFFKEA